MPKYTRPTLKQVLDITASQAKRDRRTFYVHGADTDLNEPYMITPHRPSRFRNHYRVDPDGSLWLYVRPDVPADKVPAEPHYENAG
jgi:hypothetical protein